MYWACSSRLGAIPRIFFRRGACRGNASTANRLRTRVRGAGGGAINERAGGVGGSLRAGPVKRKPR